ncbi:hypothetical protein ERJ75_000599300 [Trypanosoma vivax]|nr:hypothetical protein ERJ75_000599300 [Trypanosoma vivax]
MPEARVVFWRLAPSLVPAGHSRWRDVALLVVAAREPRALPCLLLFRLALRTLDRSPTLAARQVRVPLPRLRALWRRLGRRTPCERGTTCHGWEDVWRRLSACFGGPEQHQRRSAAFRTASEQARVNAFRVRPLSRLMLCPVASVRGGGIRVVRC